MLMLISIRDLTILQVFLFTNVPRGIFYHKKSALTGQLGKDRTHSQSTEHILYDFHHSTRISHKGGFIVIPRPRSSIYPVYSKPNPVVILVEHDAHETTNIMIINFLIFSPHGSHRIVALIDTPNDIVATSYRPLYNASSSLYSQRQRSVAISKLDRLATLG